MSDACVFCGIAEGRTPAPVVFEDENTIAFLDHRPLFPGHVLLIPRQHFETLGDLPPDQVAPLFQTARRLSIAVEQGLEAHGTFVAVNNRVSQSVPHLHVHIVPRRTKDGLKGFFWPRKPYRDQSEVEAARVSVRNAMLGLK